MSLVTLSRIDKDKALKWLIAVGLGVVGTIQYHAAQFTSQFDTFFGDRGDARGFVYFCEHWYQALLGRTNLMSPAIFYPTKGTLAFSDLLFGFAVPYSAARVVGFNMFSAVEVVIVTLTFATYLVTFFLFYRVLRFDLVPSVIGSMFFAFSSPKFFQTGHLQLQFILGLPLIFVFLISFYRRAPQLTQLKAALYLSAASLCLLLQLATAFYYAWFFVLWSSLFFVVALILPASRRSIFGLLKKYWRAIAISAAVFLLGFLPFLLIYARTLRVGDWYSYKNVGDMLPEWWSVLSMGDGNYIWGWLSAAVRPRPWPATWGELMIGIGLVPSMILLLLIVFAAYIAKAQFFNRSESSQVMFAPQASSAPYAFFAAMIVATMIFYVLGFKNGAGSSLWMYVYNYFPGTRAIRGVARYVIMLTLPISIGFAYVTHVALRQVRPRQHRVALSVVITVIAAFGVVEQFGRFKVGGTGFSRKAEMAYLRTMAAKVPRDCEAFYIAPGNGKHNPFEYHYDAMLISMLSGVPTFDGSSSQFPPGWFTMYNVKDPLYETHVQGWITLHGLSGKICRLEIDPQIEAFGIHAPSPLEDPTFFVRQQYLDFFDREPRVEELEPVVNRLRNCKPNEPLCSREEISLQLFRSSGFVDDGSFIYLLYQLAFDRAPRYKEFIVNLAELRGGENGRLKLAESFVSRSEFSNRYSALSDLGYANKLIENARVRIPNEARNALLSSRRPRSEILSELAQNREILGAFTNRAFVTLHYFGYLRRDPDADGLSNWLKRLDQTGKFEDITFRFINSNEYRERFGSR